MSINKKIIVGALTLAGILSISLAFRDTKTYSTGCETYQGYRKGPDWELYYYFDEKALEERVNKNANPPLLGNPEWTNELQIGQRYRLQIKEGFDKRLVSFQQCGDSEISSTKPE